MDSDVKKSLAKPNTNEWKLFKYWQTHKCVTSRDSKYPPLEIMDLPKMISDLIKQGYNIEKIPCTRKNEKGITKRYVEYYLKSEVELINE